MYSYFLSVINYLDFRKSALRNALHIFDDNLDTSLGTRASPNVWWQPVRGCALRRDEGMRGVLGEARV